ncbi:MAG: LysR substrate-binding domain-containing protein, partial [Nocardioides sp.]
NRRADSGMIGPMVGPASTPLRVGMVPGVMPDRWVRRWRERRPDRELDLVPVAEEDQLAVLKDGRLHLCFVRGQSRSDRRHLIPLYDEQWVAVVPVDHVLTAFDQIEFGDLAGEHLVHPRTLISRWRELAEVKPRNWPPLSDREAIELAATGAGVAVVPASVARLHHRKDLASRPVADLPWVGVGLSWMADNEDAGIDYFIGIVRGRTARSSRQR